MVFFFSLVVLQQYMDSEIRAIMAQYMPLDSQGEVPNHVNDERAWMKGKCSMGVGFSCTMFEPFWIFTLNLADCMYDMEM